MKGGTVKMKNKDFEKLFNSVSPVLPSEDLKRRVLTETRKIPFVDIKPVNKFLAFSKRYAAALGCLLIMIIAAATLTGFYTENYYEVYIDVNPSIELCVNRFGVVSKVKCINEDAEKCLKGVKLKGKNPNDAVETIAEVLKDNGYFDGDAELFVSGYSKNYRGVSKAVEALYYKLSDLAEENGYGVEVFTGEFTEQQRNDAEKEKVSPLKYAIITEVVSLDDGYSPEELANFAMDELNRVYTALRSGLTQEIVDNAKNQGITPMRYQLIKALEELDGENKSDWIEKSTSELKKLFVNEKEKVEAEMNDFVKEEAEKYGVSEEVFKTAYSITLRDSSYKIEDLVKKSLFELKALDYALEKYDILTGLFG